MVKFPNPPLASVLAQIPPIIRVVPSGTRLWRVYFQGGRYPTTWNTFRSFGPVASARFDHHLSVLTDPQRRILYAATSGPTGIAEVFQATRTIDATARAPWLVSFDLAAELHLLDLTSTWPTAAGASSAINSGPRTRARRWSQVIYEAYPTVHGLWYASSMYGNTPAIALYERGEIALPPTPSFHRALDDPVLYRSVRNLARTIRYRIVIRWTP